MERFGPLASRLVAYAQLDDGRAAYVDSLQSRVETRAAGSTLARAGEAVVHPWTIVSGWMAYSRLLADGRRQILGFVLPGEIVNLAYHRSAVGRADIEALTEIKIADIEPLRTTDDPVIDESLRIADALGQAQMMENVARLGRQSALERVALLLLELRERLSVVGLADRNSFHMPLTQQALGDALGLSIVHVNRTLMQLAREGHLERKHRVVTLSDPDGLAAAVEYHSIALPNQRAISPARSRPVLVASRSA